MRIGLTFDEYIDLKLRPHSRADRAFHQAVDDAPEKMFPMATVTAANHRQFCEQCRFEDPGPGVCPNCNKRPL
jgi:hypothetical protein